MQHSEASRRALSLKHGMWASDMHVSYMTCHLYSYMLNVELHMEIYPWYVATLLRVTYGLVRLL